eukprot:5440155-Amphidinium_carterae.1
MKSTSQALDKVSMLVCEVHYVLTWMTALNNVTCIVFGDVAVVPCSGTIQGSTHLECWYIGRDEVAALSD